MNFLSLTDSEKLRFTLLIIFLGIFLGRGIWNIEYFLLVGGLLLFTAIIIRNFWLGVLSVFLLSVFYGQFRNFSDFQNDNLVNYYGQKAEIHGIVTSFPDYREKNTRVFFKAEKIKEENMTIFRDISGSLLLIVPSNTVINYGDKLAFTAKLTRPRNFGSFDYLQFLRRFDVQTIAKNPEELIIIKNERKGSLLLRTASRTRDFLARNLEKVLPPPHSTIAMGILLGIKNELPEFTSQSFKHSALQHLLVVSGFNVTVVVLLVTILLRKFGALPVFFGSGLSIVFFVAMTGAEAPVFRAALMGLIVGFAIAFGRFSNVRNVFFLAIGVMAVYNPKIVQTDIGFFLSSAATLGIIIGIPLLSNFLKFIPEKWELRALFAVIISAQIAVSPVLGFYFNEFPVAGFFSNFFAEPLVPIGMFFSFVSSVMGILPEIPAKLIAVPAYVILEALLWIARLFSGFPVFVVSYGFSACLGAIISFILLWGSFSRKLFLKKT